jgi:UDP-3-O-[3-hydroxymyristoyl] glucosamine N-acyltransferase
MGKIAETANIGKNVILPDDVIIEDNVEIGDNTFLDYGVIIRKNTKVGKNSYIGVRCILGEYNMGFINNRIAYIQPDLLIGENAVIRSETIIYAGSVIGNNLQTGHRVTIREKSEIGNNFRIGTLSDIQGYLTGSDDQAW